MALAIKSAKEPFVAGGLGEEVTGIGEGFDGAVLLKLSVCVLGNKARSAEGFGALRGGAVGLRTAELDCVDPFGLAGFCDKFVALSSAFLLTPELCPGVVGREVGFAVAEFARKAFKFVGLRGTSLGGGGALPSPMEPTMLPRKLMMTGAGYAERKRLDTCARL